MTLINEIQIKPKSSLLSVTLDDAVACLEQRYNSMLAPRIYTNFGSILIAVNPLSLSNEEYAHLYGQSVVNDAGSEPHIYAVARKALEALRPESQETIVVIGDSGSGKTVTVGHILDYLTASAPSKSSESFFQKIIRASHLMELFANAQTCLNANSSRFGKLITLEYLTNAICPPRLMGAKIEAFLLEKSRVTSTPRRDGCGENFHIMRILVSKFKDKTGFKQVFGFERDLLESGEFAFRVAPLDNSLSSSMTYERAQHLLSTFGIDDSEQLNVMQTLACILHLSNLMFKDRDGELACDLVKEDSNVALSIHCLQSLLGLRDVEQLEMALNSKPVGATQSRRRSVYRKPCPSQESVGRRNSVARLLYSQLFEWLVKRVARSVEASVQQQEQISTKTSRIAVLDLFGFENFEAAENDFEQLCINFCNEKIQQHFAAICIGDVKRELEAEGFANAKSDSGVYTDNEKVVALFEALPSGIFCILDEKCRLNRSGMSSPLVSRRDDRAVEDDGGFMQMLTNALKQTPNNRISISKKQSSQFTVEHFSGSVTYSCGHFVEKCRDDVSPDLVSFFSQTIGNDFIQSLVSSTSRLGQTQTQSTCSPASAIRKRSLATKYRAATASLVDFLCKSTNVHYVRCIRPNNNNNSNISNARSAARLSMGLRQFDRSYVASQLANAGLVDVLRLANQQGKLNRRMSYSEFQSEFAVLFQRFNSLDNDDKENLCPESDKVLNSKVDFKANVDRLLRHQLPCSSMSKFWLERELFIGTSKLLLSASALEWLQRLKLTVLLSSVRTVQRQFKRVLQSNKKKRQQLEEQKQKAQQELQMRNLMAQDEDDSVGKSLPNVGKQLFVSSLLGVVSRRHIEGCGLFRWHAAPNPLLPGAHVANARLLKRQLSITDCLD